MTEEKPAKKIGLLALIALVISSSIGSGVFGLTSDLASASAPGPVLIAWVIVGFGILMLALSLNNLLMKEPELEGFSLTLKRALAPLPASLVAGVIGCQHGWGT